MKLIVQIPCYNEEETLPLVVRSIPRSIPGVDEVRILIIDDGSRDRTIEVARELGVDYIVRHSSNRGLASAFRSGIDACLRLGADVIVNTDGDNQYPQEEIPRLIQPILSGEADMVVADRQVDEIDHFSPQKKRLEKLGSWTVRKFSGVQVADAPSGFRAFTREVAQRLNVITNYSYTLDTLVQAGRSGMKIANVKVRTNPKTRESRLVRGTIDYVVRSGTTILRVYAMYEALKVFFLLGLVVMLLGTATVLRWLYFFLSGDGAGNVQSLVLAAALLVIGFQVCIMGVLADLISSNRRLIEQVLDRVKRIERGEEPPPIERGDEPPPTKRGSDPRPVERGVEPPPVQRGVEPPPVQRGTDPLSIERGVEPPPVEGGEEPPPVEQTSTLPLVYDDRPRRPDSGRSEELVR